MELVGTLNRKAGAALWRRPWLRGVFVLTPPLAWYLVIYLASLVAMLVTAFFTVDPLTGNIQHNWTLSNFSQVLTQSDYHTIILRTVIMAALVTVTDVVVAVPFAYFMVKVARRRFRQILIMLVLIPLWANYLARVYAWVNILSDKGLLPTVESHLGLPHTYIAYSNTAMWVVFCYLWLPFMIVPIYGALERVPDSLLEASSDLGASSFATFRRVLMPLILPGIVAGSIFTFSLTLGDYITPLLIGGTKANFIGDVIYTNIGIANNVPFAAAMALVPIVIMGLYLSGARALGAFEAL